MLSPFEVASAVEVIGGGRFRGEVPDGWQQGRGAFGGLVLALLLRAMEKTETDRARVVRTLIGDIAGPVAPGEVEVRVFPLRRGSNQSNLRAELVQNGEIMALASAVLSTPRARGIDLRPRAPEIAAARDVAVVPMGAPAAPVFTQHYEYRAMGGGPCGVSAEPAIDGWVRERIAPSAIDAPALWGLLDSFWPACFVTLPKVRPAATVSFTAEILCDPRALDPREPLRYRSRTICDHEGFQLETRELYDPSGDVVAMNQQTFAVLK
jgi:acyl-CoA thioesterase